MQVNYGYEVRGGHGTRCGVLGWSRRGVRFKVRIGVKQGGQRCRRQREMQATCGYEARGKGGPRVGHVPCAGERGRGIQWGLGFSV